MKNKLLNYKLRAYNYIEKSKQQIRPEIYYYLQAKLFGQKLKYHYQHQAAPILNGVWSA